MGAVTTGCRRGEALGLTWEAVETDLHRLTFSEAVVLAGGKPIRKGTKTDKERTVDVQPETIEALELWRLRQAEEFDRLEAVPRGDTSVFTDEKGEVLHPAYVGEEFRRIVAGLPLKPIRLHDLRHSHATA